MSVGRGGVDLRDAHSCLEVRDWAEVELEPKHGDRRFSKLSLYNRKGGAAQNLQPPRFKP